MCRLFYSLRQPNPESKIMRFLKQSNHLEKNTPGIDSASDHDTHPDGFGLASFRNGRWGVYKTIRMYTEVENLSTVVNQIANDSEIIIGHIRRMDSRYTSIAYENTHPFYYRNRLFMHNGFLKQYTSYRAEFLRHIRPSLRDEIKGDTDSEIVFYLFLSILGNESSKYFEAVVRTFEIIRKIVPEYTANIVYVDKDYSLIIRTSYGGPCPPSLYLNHSKGGILISSEPISRKYEVVPEHTCYIIHHSSGNRIKRTLY